MKPTAIVPICIRQTTHTRKIAAFNMQLYRLAISPYSVTYNLIVGQKLWVLAVLTPQGPPWPTIHTFYSQSACVRWTKLDLYSWVQFSLYKALSSTVVKCKAAIYTSMLLYTLMFLRVVTLVTLGTCLTLSTHRLQTEAGLLALTRLASLDHRSTALASKRRKCMVKQRQFGVARTAAVDDIDSQSRTSNAAYS